MSPASCPTKRQSKGGAIRLRAHSILLAGSCTLRSGTWLHASLRDAVTAEIKVTIGFTRSNHGCNVTFLRRTRLVCVCTREQRLRRCNQRGHVINKEDALPVFDHLRKSQCCSQNGKELKRPDLACTIFKEIQQPSRAGQGNLLYSRPFSQSTTMTPSTFRRTLLSSWFFAKDASLYSSSFFRKCLPR